MQLPVRGRFRCRVIENLVCAVYKPLHLWRVPTRIADPTVWVCMPFAFRLALNISDYYFLIIQVSGITWQSTQHIKYTAHRYYYLHDYWHVVVWKFLHTYSMVRLWWLASQFDIKLFFWIMKAKILSSAEFIKSCSGRPMPCRVLLQP